MNRLVLVNPRFPPSLWDFSGCRAIDGSGYAFPPLALATVAGLTPPGYSVCIQDENLAPIDLDGYDLVGITGFLIQKDRVIEIARRCRENGQRVVVGGPVVVPGTIDELLEVCDSVFQNEAELTWPAFMADLAAGRPRRLYRQDELVDLAISPPPRYDLLAVGRYASAILETSRGCPHSCEFCEIPARLGKRTRVKPLDAVMNEVGALVALGIDAIFFIDDNFFGSRRRAVELLRLLAGYVAGLDRDLYFVCQITIDVAGDDEILDLMQAANVRRVFVGLETPRREQLAAIGKRQNLKGDMVSAVRNLQRRGIFVWCGLVVGFDGDDKAVFDEQLGLLRDASIPVAMMGLLQAIPNTPLHERLRLAGRLKEDVAPGGVRGAQATALATNIVPLDPGRLDEAGLLEGYRRMVREAYRYDAFAERLKGALAQRPTRHPTRRPARRASAPMTWRKLRVVVNLLRHYLLTTDGERRRAFLGLLAHVRTHAPDSLEQLAIHLIAFKHLREYYYGLSLPDVERTTY